LTVVVLALHLCSVLRIQPQAMKSRTAQLRQTSVLGRFLISHKEGDLAAFKTPDIKNIIIGDRQGQHEQKLRPVGTGQLGRHVVGQHLDLGIPIKFARNLPSVLAIVEGRRVSHIVGAVDLSLHREDILTAID
jgi:hypothetical protein